MRHDDQQQARDAELQARDVDDVRLAQARQPQERALERDVLERWRVAI